MTVCEMLSSEGFPYNSKIARNVGVHEAIVMGFICSYEYFKENDFHLSSEMFTYCTGLSEKQVRKALSTLKGMGFIGVEKKGIPCQNWYRINRQAIENYLKAEE